MNRHDPMSAIPTASTIDTLRFFARVLAPTWAKGVIIRRKAIVSLAERFALDDGAVRQMEALNAKYGAGPVLLNIPLRRQAVLLDEEDVRRVLDGTPDPFTSASDEKHSALAHFEPETSLITRGADRASRRAFNEDALETGCPRHSAATRLERVVGQEISRLLEQSEDGVLDWPRFSRSWFRIVRRIVLGDAAADDEAFTALLDRLRGRANWAFALRRDRSGIADLHARLDAYRARAEPGSLAANARLAGTDPRVAPTHQIAQWLFAFDPAGMTTFRALAVLATHAEHRARVKSELEGQISVAELAYLRACVVETLRLWPTTPAILRQTTRPTSWRNGSLPAETGIIIFTPFFHRARVPDPDRFDPGRWLYRDPADLPPMVPFSAGPAACPARHLVPMVAGMALACILREASVTLLEAEKLDPDAALPGTLDPYGLGFRLGS